MSVARAAGLRCSRIYFDVRIAGIAAGLIFIAPSAGQAQSVTLTTSYDALGRLSQATYPGGVTIAYAYDAAGNRSSYVTTGSANPPPTAPTPIGQLIKTPAATPIPSR